MKSNKILRSIAVTIGIVVLLSFGWSFLCFSGVLPIFVSPIAYERINYSNLQTLSEIVSLTTAETPYIEWNYGIFEKQIDSIETLKYELPDKQQYSVHSKPITSLNIILSGIKEDKLGMVWAITDQGNVIKVSAKMLIQKN